MKRDFENKEGLYISNLKDIKEVFDRAGVKFWLDWGTLLGAVRDKRVIPWDMKDTDIGVFDKDYERIIAAAPEFKKKGFLVNEIDVPVPNENFLYKKFSFCRFGYCADVYLYDIRGQNIISVLFAPDRGSFSTRFIWFLWCSLVSAEINVDSERRLFFIPKTAVLRFSQFCLSWLPKDYLIKKMKKSLIKKIKKDKGRVLLQMAVAPKHYFEKLDKIEFYGMEFNTPNNVQDYLRFKYGENWKIPDRKWDYRNDGAAKPMTG